MKDDKSTLPQSSSLSLVSRLDHLDFLMKYLERRQQLAELESSNNGGGSVGGEQKKKQQCLPMDSSLKGTLSWSSSSPLKSPPKKLMASLGITHSTSHPPLVAPLGVPRQPGLASTSPLSRFSCSDLASIGSNNLSSPRVSTMPSIASSIGARAAPRLASTLATLPSSPPRKKMRNFTSKLLKWKTSLAVTLTFPMQL